MANSQERSRASILFTSAKMAIATFCSRILGLVREQLIAATFGASGLTDAFYVAYRIPNLLRDLFAEGAFSSAFVPIFTESKIKQNSKETFQAAFWTLLIITGLLSVVIFFASPVLVGLFAPSFKSDPEKFQLTILMVRVISPFLLVISLAALLMGVLNTYKIFFLPAITPAFLNLSVICSILFLSTYIESMGYHSILSIALGVFIGGILQFLIQLPSVLKKGYSFAFPNKLFTKNVKRILIKMGPGMIGFSVNQLNLLVNTILATSSGVIGALSFLNWGFRLFQFPNGILSVSLGNSHLVHFSEKWKNNKKSEAIDLFQSTITLSLTLLIPITITILVFPDWISNIVFERGQFSRQDTLNTATVLFYYALSIPFYGLYKITVPLFYSIDKEKIPVFTSIISILINITFALSFIDQLGFVVLAMSLSLATICNLLMQLIFLKKYLSLKASFFLNTKYLKMLIAGIAAFFFAKFLKSTQLNLLDEILIKKLLYFSTFSFLVLSLFLLLLYILGERNFIYKIRKK